MAETQKTLEEAEHKLDAICKEIHDLSDSLWRLRMKNKGEAESKETLCTP